MLRVKIQEIIPLTIQGEGFNQGMPCGFLRLFGCPVNCYFCDTGYAGQGNPPPFYGLLINDILQELSQTDNIVITGGEPCVSPCFEMLISSLLAENKKIFVETSGIKSHPFLENVWVTLSPKEHISKTGKLDRNILTYINELKLIISDESDFDYYQDIIEVAKTRSIPVYVQPEWSKREGENTLMSFADKKNNEDKINLYTLKENLLPRILIDSGAWTAFTTGKKINREDYIDWALDFKKQWGHKVKSLYFMNLDVIGDQEKSDINFRYIRKNGLPVLPIFTYKADIKYLEQMLVESEYIALGGLVGTQGDKSIEAWLDYCFRYINAYYKQTGVLRKTHLLGITKEKFLRKYPLYSCDSSSWVSCLRFGKGGAIGKKKIPRYNESPEALKITIITLKREIQKYRKMQDEITLL